MNSNISGKPRDERDPKLMELNKHIEEVVEKEQHVPRTKSTASNESTEGVAKYVLSSLKCSSLFSNKYFLKNAFAKSYYLTHEQK